MKAVKKSRMKPVSTAKRPDRLIRNGGVGNGAAPSYLRTTAMVLVAIAIAVVGSIIAVGVALV